MQASGLPAVRPASNFSGVLGGRASAVAVIRNRAVAVIAAAERRMARLLTLERILSRAALAQFNGVTGAQEGIGGTLHRDRRRQSRLSFGAQRLGLGERGTDISIG